MTDCVLHSLEAYFDYWDRPLQRHERIFFKLVRRLAQGPGPQMTEGAIVPFIVRRICAQRRWPMNFCHRVWTPAHYREQAGPITRLLIWDRDFGPQVDEIPQLRSAGIYCDVFKQHAWFSTTSPPRAERAGGIVLAFF